MIWKMEDEEEKKGEGEKEMEKEKEEGNCAVDSHEIQ